MTERVYSWETDYEKSWEVLKEDTDGFLQKSINKILEKAKTGSLFSAKSQQNQWRLTMMRHLFIIIDISESMVGNLNANIGLGTSVNVASDDYKPNKAIYCLRVLKKFIQEFFDLNPLGQISLLYTCNKRAEKLSELSGNPGIHIKGIDKIISLIQAINNDDQATLKSTNSTFASLVTQGRPLPGGEPSLQNALSLATSTLRHVSRHTSREILIIFGSLSTCDPDDIHETIQTLAQNHIVCSLISLTAEVYVYKRLCRQTAGHFHVAVDCNHFEALLLKNIPIHANNSNSSTIGITKQTDVELKKGEKGDNDLEKVTETHLPTNDSTSNANYFSFLQPPPSYTQSEASLIRVGFPRYEDNSVTNRHYDQSNVNLVNGTGDASNLVNGGHSAHYNGRSNVGSLTSTNKNVIIPQNSINSLLTLSACACHLSLAQSGTEAPQETASASKNVDRTSKSQKSPQASSAVVPFAPAGYYCPVCKSKYCELPVECRVCGLTLISAPHLARSYSHLFPPKPFSPVHLDRSSLNERNASMICHACFMEISPEIENYMYECGGCRQLYCTDCTVFINETLHSCPGCAMTGKNL